VKPRSQKQLQGLRTLDKNYVEEEKARIAAAELRRLQIERLAKEQKA